MLRQTVARQRGRKRFSAYCIAAAVCALFTRSISDQQSCRGEWKTIVRAVNSEPAGVAIENRNTVGRSKI